MQRIWIDRAQDLPDGQILTILGPTGSGKTSTVLGLVKERFPNPKAPLLVSVDAVAIYRELDLGSAKPLGPERDDFDWAGIDLLRPVDEASMSRYLNQVQPQIAQALKDHRPVYLVGGSHFYERALVDGTSPGAATDPEFLASLKEFPNDALYARLEQLDPQIAERIHVNDRYRLQRYLDLVERQGFRYADLFSPSKDTGLAALGVTSVHCLALGMDFDRAAVEARLSKRIAEMLKEGWIAETEALIGKYGAQAPALKTIGYREITEHLQGLFPRAELEERILISHRQLAKRQRTWIRGLKSKDPLD